MRFASTIKADLVIPNKVFQLLSMRKPVITAETSASRYYLKNNENVLLTMPGCGLSLKNAILKLRDNNELRLKIAEEGYKLYNEKFSLKATYADLGEFYKSILSNKRSVNR